MAEPIQTPGLPNYAFFPDEFREPGGQYVQYVYAEVYKGWMRNSSPSCGYWLVPGTHPDDPFKQVL